MSSPSASPKPINASEERGLAELNRELNSFEVGMLGIMDSLSHLTLEATQRRFQPQKKRNGGKGPMMKRQEPHAVVDLCSSSSEDEDLDRWTAKCEETLRQEAAEEPQEEESVTFLPRLVLKRRQPSPAPSTSGDDALERTTPERIASLKRHKLSLTPTPTTKADDS